MMTSRFSKVLLQLHNTLGMSEIRWVVTGSLGLSLQGMDMEVHDIDIQTDKAGAYDIDISSKRHFINYGGLSIPVLSLDYECEAYEKLGRMEKAKQIKKYLMGVLRG